MFDILKFKELFPSKWNFAVFFLYIALFVNQGLLVTASQDSNNSYQYNTVIAVLLTEVVKLILSLILFTWRNPCSAVFEETRKNLNLLWLYFIPAGLYCLYNNLTFINLSLFDPTTYFVLLQFRVVVTGIIFQCGAFKIMNAEKVVKSFTITSLVMGTTLVHCIHHESGIRPAVVNM